MPRPAKKVKQMPEPTVDQLAKGYLDLGDQIRALERERERLKGEIMERLNRLGVDKLQAGAYRIIRSVCERAQLNREKLLELGVAPQTIAQATTYTKFERLTISTGVENGQAG